MLKLKYIPDYSTIYQMLGGKSVINYWSWLRKEAQCYASPKGVVFIGDAGCDGLEVERGDIVPQLDGVEN